MVTARTDASTPRTSTPRTEDGIKRRGARDTSKRAAPIAARRKSSQYTGPDGGGKGNSGLGGSWVVPVAPFAGGSPARRGAAIAPATWTLASPALNELASPA